MSPMSGAVLEAVAAAEGWQERARRAMAKRNSGQKLSKCLSWLASSIDRALEQLTMRVTVRCPCNPLPSSLLHSLYGTPALQNRYPEHTTHLMDCAFLGLIYGAGVSFREAWFSRIGLHCARAQNTSI